MRLPAALLVLSATAWLVGCNLHPNSPEAFQTETVARPSDILDFGSLYKVNCSACHGENGSGGPSIDLANPEYQALVDDATLRKLISKGIPGTQMPAFAQANEGMLTNQQIDSIIAGMRKAWSRPNAFSGAVPPPYAQTGRGDAQNGQRTYQARCAVCHKNSNGQITSPVYLALVSDQALRTFIIAGSPDIGQPDWRHDSADGKLAPPLTSQEVDDVVGYLASLRTTTPAFPTSSPNLQPRNMKAR